VKVYGVNPKRFVNIINTSIEVIKGVTPLGEEGASSKENSE